MKMKLLQKQQLQRLQQQLQNAPQPEVTHLALPNGHYLTTTQPGLAQLESTDQSIAVPAQPDTPQQLTVVGLPSPSPEPPCRASAR